MQELARTCFSEAIQLNGEGLPTERVVGEDSSEGASDHCTVHRMLEELERSVDAQGLHIIALRHRVANFDQVLDTVKMAFQERL